MPQIFPFKGFHYTRTDTKSLENLTAPPYDAIDADLQKKLYDKDQDNIIRLILGYQYDSDSDSDNRYTRAAEQLKTWLDNNVMASDGKPSLYRYVQNFKLPNGQVSSRVGFIGLMRLPEGEGKEVKAHELTHAGPKADRLKLMQACSGNFSPILLLYDDPPLKVEKALATAPDGLTQAVVDPAGVEHILTQVTDEAVCKMVHDELKDSPLYIADGHHRFETAMNYRDWAKAQKGELAEDAPENHMMVYLTNLSSPGLSILPIYRIMKNINSDLDKIISDLKKDWDITEHSLKEKDLSAKAAEAVAIVKPAEGETTVIGIYVGDNKLHRLALKADADPDKLIPGDKSKVWKSLDVSICQRLLIEKAFSITDLESQIDYSLYLDEVFRQVDSGEAVCSLVLNATGVEQVMAVTEQGERMPQKSTNFYPKLLSGLLINLFKSQESIKI